MDAHVSKSRRRYVAPIAARPETDEYDRGFTAMFGHKCRACKADMAGEDPRAVYCGRCKGEGEDGAVVFRFGPQEFVTTKSQLERAFPLKAYMADPST